MDIKNLLENCNDDVKEFISSIVTQLEVDYGTVPNEFMPNLFLIRDWMKIYVNAKNDVFEYGLISRDNENRVAKSRAFSCMNIAFQNISKIMNQFSLSPLNKERMKKLISSTQHTDISAQEILENLLK